jgi:zinc protease
MKRFLLLFLLAAAPLAAQDAGLRVPYTRFSLPNGLTVILHEDHTLPIVSVNAYYHVGSGREKPGRTGFAHLFEHLMFEGSQHVPEGKFDEWLEAVGGDNNGSTTEDRTNYFEDVPSNAIEIPLFLESDRMGYLLGSMSPEKVNGQRDVVKNERRQSYENRPYGLASIVLSENLYPAGHPYHWPVIGSMEDLTAASYEDVVEFFKTWYVPNNASLVIAGDFDPVRTRTLVEKWFGDIPAGRPVPPSFAPPVVLTEERRLILEDRVQLPRLYISWPSPRGFAPGDAELDLLSSILSSGKNSRLYKKLVYDRQIAQDVTAYQGSSFLASDFSIIATARPGHTLPELLTAIQEEIDLLKQTPPGVHELHRAVNQYEAGFLRRMEQVGGFGGKADQLNNYFFRTGNPDYAQEDMARYQAIAPEDLSAAAYRYLRDDGRVVLSIVPTGHRELAVPAEGGSSK